MMVVSYEIEARSSVFLGLHLVISHHHSELPNTNWTVVTDYAFLLPVYCECVRNRVRSDPLSSLCEILLSTLTTGYVPTLGRLSGLRWWWIMAWLRQITPQRGWSLRHLSLASPWEARSLPVFVHPLSCPGNGASHRNSQASSHMPAQPLGKREVIEGN